MASGNDIKAANETYDSFITVVKVSTPLIALITAAIVYIISR